jgi:large subunit ribosomal protein L16
MTSPIKRPFKIWSKSHVLSPNLVRFNSAVSGSEVPPFLEYFFLTNFRPIKFTRRVVVRAAAYSYLSKQAIEAFRKVVAPYFRKKAKGASKFYIRCYAHLPLMKKPAEVRMGGGKGSKLRGYVCPVRPGQILFELTFRPFPWSNRLLRHASRKLSFPVSVSYI